jgi:hypothetical protein
MALLLPVGFLTRLIIPRKVRRAVHPVRTVKRAASPRSDPVDDAGKVTLRYAGNLFHIGVGRPYKRSRVIVWWPANACGSSTTNTD